MYNDSGWIEQLPMLALQLLRNYDIISQLQIFSSCTTGALGYSS